MPKTSVLAFLLIFSSVFCGKLLAHCQVPCGVYGSVIEINERLTVDLLRNDPLRTGYLAILRPVGPFPPPSLAIGNPPESDSQK